MDHFDKREKTAIFIDGANTHACLKGLREELDYSLMLKFFRQYTRFIRAYYYTAVPQGDEYASIRPLVDWLNYNGYTMVTKPTKTHTGVNGERRVKGNMDVEMVVGMLKLAPYIDHLVIFTGDGDFKAAVAAVQDLGKRVTVISSMNTSPPMVADELRRQSDFFLDLGDLITVIHEMGDIDDGG